MAERHAIEIEKRPPHTWSQTIHATIFFVLFSLGCTMVNLSQFVALLPFYFLPFSFTKSIYDAGIRLSKGSFGTLLILMSQYFAPTRLTITFQLNGPGAFSQDEIDNMAIRDRDGRVSSLKLPRKCILVANHQVYADWWYAWCLTYFMDTHKDVCIVLKKSLKWVPIVGWGMQFFRFIFLARSWASDSLYLVKQLSLLGKRAQDHDTPLTFILYPEGTLVSPDTRPVSKKYADKLGISDMSHTLLPRSTGLFYSLRALSSCVPDLQLLDITMGYPGVPPTGYGQSYYTLRSIFFDRIPPPAVHMHIRRFDVAKHVPIGAHSGGGAARSQSNGSPHGQTIGVDVPEDERKAFDVWLQDRWSEKDQLMQHFYDTGSFSPSLDKFPPLDIPLQLRHKSEILDAYCFFIPAIVGYAWTKICRLAL